MYFGGIWGGQLQRWNNNKYDSAGKLGNQKNKLFYHEWQD